MESSEQSKRRKIKYASLSVETAPADAYSNEASERIVQTEQSAFEMPADKESCPYAALSTQTTNIVSSDVSSFPSIPKIIAIKVFFDNEYCIFRATSETSLRQVLAEASEFWNISPLQYTFVDEHDWVVSLWEKVESLQQNAQKDVVKESNQEENRNTCKSPVEYIQLWLVEKDKKKKSTCQDNTNSTNLRTSLVRTSFYSSTLSKSKDISQVSPIFRFPMKGDLHLDKDFKRDDERTFGDNNGQNIPGVDKTQYSQTGEVAKLLVSLYPQNKDSDFFGKRAPRTDSTLTRTSRPRAAVNHPLQRHNISPSLKTQIESLLMKENERAFCHICGRHDVKKPWLIRCKITECAMFYHPDCARWIPFDATSCSIHDEEHMLRVVLNDLSNWKCPKHQCAECGVDSSPLASCTLCTISYCSKHVPPCVRPFQMSPYDWQENLEKKSRRIICDVCLNKETKSYPSNEPNETMDIEQSFPVPVCVMNLETILLPRVDSKSLEFPWFGTHFMELRHREVENIQDMEKTQTRTFQQLEASSDSTIGYSEDTPKNTEALTSSQKRPYIRRISPESLKRNDFDFRLNDGSVVKLGPLLSMKLTDDDVAAGLTSNRVLQAAFIILRDEKKPLDARALAERASQRGFHCLSLMPNNTFSSQIYRNMKRKKEHSAFYKVNNGEFGLKIWLHTRSNANGEDGEAENQKTHDESLPDEVRR